MKKLLSIGIIFFILFSILLPCRAQASESVLQASNFETYVFPENVQRSVILRQYNNETKDGLPVLSPYAENTADLRVVEKLFTRSYMRESVKLHFMVQNFLINKGKRQNHYPAYLFLSNNSGGFPKYGFYLKQNGQLGDRKDANYIDLVKRANTAENYLASMTQIYPHEMGHTFYRALTLKSNNPKNLRYSIDMHYTGQTTDYCTAFDEGFAEHFQVMAVDNEPDPETKNGIAADLLNRRKYYTPRMNGYNRDFLLPLRLGYYRMAMGMGNWYQQFEQLKRYDYVKSGVIKHPQTDAKLGNIDDRLLFRNAYTKPDTSKLRNPAQMVSTEGVVATVFVKLMESDLKNRYLDMSYYTPFLKPGSSYTGRPEEIFTPTQNEYIKIFTVFYKYMDYMQTANSQLIDFVKGYGSEFPEEKEKVFEIFKEATGSATENGSIDGNIGPQLWILNSSYSHNTNGMIQYKAKSVPFYTFNLNAADMADLMTIKGIKRGEAQAILEYRDKQSYFFSMDELNDVPGVSKETVEEFIGKKLSYEKFIEFQKRASARYEARDIQRYSLTNGLKGIALNGLPVFAIFFLLFVLAFYRGERKFKTYGILLTRKLLKFLLITLLGLYSVYHGAFNYVFYGNLEILNQGFAWVGNLFKEIYNWYDTNAIPVYLTSLFILILLELGIFAVKRDVKKGKEAIFSTLCLGFMILYSVY